MAIEQVAYIGLFLIGRVLEWFKPYFIKVQLNGLNTTNIEVCVRDIIAVTLGSP